MRTSWNIDTTACLLRAQIFGAGDLFGHRNPPSARFGSRH
jgi:hypothetical protein